MPQYNYRALNPAGRNVRGQLNANNDRELYQRLREVGLELIDFSLVTRKRGRVGRIKTRDLVQLCLHLEHLSAAGVSLLEGLADVRDSTDQARLRDILSEVTQDVAQGLSLSQAMGRHPTVFGTVFTSLISAGETSGNMTDSFHQLVHHLRWNEQITNKVKKAVRYPTFMLVVMLLVFTFMMVAVVPDVVSFLKSTGQELPGVTLALIATSDFVVNYWYVLLILPVVLGVGIAVGRRTSESFAYSVDYLILRTPAVGDLVRKISLSRFAHFFAVMFRAGVPILNCLETAQKVVNNLCLGRSVGTVRTGVQDGVTLSAAMRESGEFPSLVLRMVKIGEDSGNLSDTLENVTSFYDEEVNNMVDAVIAMIEPTLTIVSGGLLLWVAIAVIMPIYDSFGKLGL